MGFPPASALGLQLFSGQLAAACPLPARLGGWPGMAWPRWARRAGPPGLWGWTARGVSLPPPGPSQGEKPGCCPLSPLDRMRGPWLRHQSTLGEFQAKHSREGTGARGGQGPAVPVSDTPHPPPMPISSWCRSGVMVADAQGGAERLLGAVPTLDGVQLCLRPPAQLPPPGWACRGLSLCGEPEPLGLGVNGGCGRGCLVPPLGWCRPWGDKGAGRKAAASGAGTPVPGMAERPGRAVGGVEPVGTAGALRARLGVGAARGRSASQGRNSVRPVKRVGTTWAGCDGGSLQSGTGSPGF